jgi:hypothetical protein
MRIISHRGNIQGKILSEENSPEYINEALIQGFDVEIDVWFLKNTWYLGHDEPQYKVGLDFILNDSFWCHAKNFESLVVMMKCGAHCFWHQEDDYTLTNQGIIWTYPNKNISSRSIIVCLDDQSTHLAFDSGAYGICSDFVGLLNKK